MLVRREGPAQLRDFLSETELRIKERAAIWRVTVKRRQGSTLFLASLVLRGEGAL